MTRTLLRFLNPIQWIEALRFARRTARLDPGSFDLELYLYSQLLSTDMLHYGYFDHPDVGPDEISIRDFERAQLRYAERIAEHVATGPLLDVGCGMGGLTQFLSSRGHQVHALTPNDQQATHMRQKHPGTPCHHCKFEDFESAQKFGTIINAESLQYIPLNAAFKKVEAIRLPDTTWIICDYFKRHPETKLKSSHLLSDFRTAVAANGWTVAYEEDVTPHVIPTIRMGEFYANRFLKPGLHFAGEKLRHKKPGLYYMLHPLREKVTAKVGKIADTVNAAQWQRDKQYMLFVLKKS